MWPPNNKIDKVVEASAVELANKNIEELRSIIFKLNEKNLNLSTENQGLKQRVFDVSDKLRMAEARVRDEEFKELDAMYCAEKLQREELEIENNKLDATLAMREDELTAMEKEFSRILLWFEGVPETMRDNINSNYENVLENLKKSKYTPEHKWRYLATMIDGVFRNMFAYKAYVNQMTGLVDQAKKDRDESARKWLDEQKKRQDIQHLYNNLKEVNEKLNAKACDLIAKLDDLKETEQIKKENRILANLVQRFENRISLVKKEIDNKVITDDYENGIIVRALLR
jgi:hypothetical protein